MAHAFYENPAFLAFRRTFGAGTVLLEQGSSRGDLCILIRGVLEVSRDGYLVGEVVEPGSILGEMSLILSRPHGSTVTALTDAELVVIPRNRVRELVERIPEFPMKVMRTLATRLESANQRIVELENSYDQLYNRIESGAPSEEESGIFQKTVVVQPPTVQTDGVEPVAKPAEEPSGSKMIPGLAYTLPESVEEELRQPLLVRTVRCPAHLGPEEFPIYLLRKASQRFSRDAFGMTLYTGAEDGYAPLDYTLQEVHVCPVCHFASSVPDNFIGLDAGEATAAFTIRRKVREMLTFGLDVRKAMVGTLALPQQLHSPQRGLPEARTAFDLAITTASTFFEVDPTVFSTFGFRLVVYYLKLAQMQRKYRDRTAEEIYLGRAYELVNKHMTTYTGAQYFAGYHLSVVLALRLEGRKAAAKSLETFRRLRERLQPRLEPRLADLCRDYYMQAKDAVDGKHESIAGYGLP